ncbi:hypothetical protein MKY27_07505 [Solibacillus sp. FSL R5-0449]|uniref:hypothetical protein n=1 Tax=Solibacillus sp. FSL R5-0449 TaxID=2921639 RepID=UPI0030CEBADA
MGGCSNSFFVNDTTITSIEILKFASASPSPEEYSEQEGEVISVIKSKEEIKRIINTIERAGQESTESMNIALPNHLIIFKENKNVIFTLGYYPNINNGNDEFLDLDKDKIYKTNALNLIQK